MLVKINEKIGDREISSKSNNIKNCSIPKKKKQQKNTSKTPKPKKAPEYLRPFL